MALYEHVLIARQDISSQQVDSLIEDITKLIGEHGGKTAKTEYWGLRTLTYRIRKNRKGHYALLHIDAPAAAVHEMERLQRLNEDVLRYITVRVEAFDEEPSPILARKDRDDRRRSRREGRDDADRFDDRDGGDSDDSDD